MSIDERVQAVVKEMRTTLETTWAGTMGEKLRPWMNFAGIAKVGKFDFDGLFGSSVSPSRPGLFERKKISDDYTKARQKDTAVSKEIWIPKLSSDLLAGSQRDHAMRMRSRVRFMAHAATRQKANSVDTGPLTVNTITLLARLDAAQEE